MQANCKENSDLEPLSRQLYMIGKDVAFSTDLSDNHAAVQYP
jgi:hypothetical protein